MGALWGTLAAVGIGFSDLFGRRIVNAASAVTAAFWLQVFGAVTALVSVVFVASEWRSIDMGLSLLSGLGFAAGLGLYFGGLSHSSATVVSPTVAILSSVIPYAWSLIRGGEATALAFMGALVAFAGLAVISGGGGPGVESQARIRQGLFWGLASGLGYGFGMSVAIEFADGTGAWPAVGQRVMATAALGLAGLLGGHRLLVSRPLVPSAVASGIAGGLTSVFILIGLNVDAPPTVVTTSLFPLFTVAVGYLAYRDQVTRVQAVGVVACVIGVAAVVAG